MINKAKNFIISDPTIKDFSYSYVDGVERPLFSIATQAALVTTGRKG